MDYKKLNILTGWITFGIAAIVYLLTIEPTASFWDCGEFIASAYKLEVGHPPGAPFFMLVGRIFSMFAPLQYVPTAINVMSALCSAATIGFLFWTITAFARKLLKKPAEEMSLGDKIAVLGSGLIGGLAYTFSDSFWFSAVEGEVYAMSSMFTAMVFWAIMKYDEKAEEQHSTRWIILIAYLVGLSIGVHLLNLLAIPAIALVYYFRNFQVTRKGLIYTLVISVLILGVIQSVIIPGTFGLAGKFELLFVNAFGLPFFSGLTFYILLLAGAIAYGLYYTHKKGKAVWNTVILSFAVILIGYSTFAMIMIRSSANPPMDENNPEDVFSLMRYLNREQYGDRPLLYGQYWMAPLDSQDPKLDGDPVYMKAYVVKEGARELQSFQSMYDAERYMEKTGKSNLEVEKRYVISDPKKDAVYNYDDRFCSVFPRMYSPQQNHIDEYKRWSDFEGKPIRVASNQGSKILNKPTMGENLKFFTRYQLDWMYWRYFFWNFAGRQNDIQGHGNIIHGNWLTGLDFIDAERLDNQEKLPAFIKENKAYNHYFLLPFILGIIGLVFQFTRDLKQWSVVALLFGLTGIAIVIYLNQYPIQPRERDYAYVGSFYAFAIWIGLAVLALYEVGKNFKIKDLKKVAMYGAGAGVVFFLFESLGGGGHALSYSMFYITAVGLGMCVLSIALSGVLKNHKSLALFGLLICIPVPLIMGMENWDDHSRAKRRTGVDFAKNYLDSCEPNAILFTNGDNDTFPLWYVQEVEGYRTDVRVVNLSLLNTDWYIDQMRRKAYDSDPVPFSMEEWMYRQGTRDIVLLDDSRNKSGRYINLKQAIDFVKDDNNKIQVSTKERMHYIPTKTFRIPVNKQKALENGVVAPEDSALIADGIEWKLNRNYILKNSLMVLDLLANNNWERPIYFAVTTGSDAYLGLQNYFQLEGLAYRLVPIKSTNSGVRGVRGRIAEDIMYDNMMNDFQWGNVEEEDLYMDENNLRMATNLRLQFSNLADAFINKGELKTAKEVLDECLRVMPEKNVPYTRIMMPILESYYEVGDQTSAEELGEKLFDIHEDELEYYLSLTPESQQKMMQEMRITYAVANRLVQVTKRFGDQERAKALEARFKVMDQRMNEAIQRIQNIDKYSF